MRKVLMIIPYYNIYPPQNGGMQRCFHMLHQMAKYFEVTAMTFQHPDEIRVATDDYPALKNVQFLYVENKKRSGNYFKEKIRKVKSALFYRWYMKSINDSVDSIFLSYLPYLSRILRFNNYDVVVLENLSAVKLSRFIRNRKRDAAIYYDAHNFDSHLAALAFNTGKIRKSQYYKIVSLERNLHKTIDGIFVCSEVDAEKFYTANNRKLTCHTVPNGVSMRSSKSNVSAAETGKPTIIFCGSLDYNPNIEGLCWFLNNCWNDIKQAIPRSNLIIIGSGSIPDKIRVAADKEGVKLIGKVKDTMCYYDASAVAIVPIWQGSGTRLKLLEAMERRVPVVSTSIGAEGIDYTNEKDILIADNKDEFCSSVIELLLNTEKRATIAIDAYKLVERKYSWDTIGQKLSNILMDKSGIDIR